MVHRPNWKQKGQNLKGFIRTVTLPDWQGLGLNFILSNTIAVAYKVLGWRMWAYPAHPPWIRAVMQSKKWKLIKKPQYTQKYRAEYGNRPLKCMKTVSRPCAIFEYCGAAMDRISAQRLIG